MYSGNTAISACLFYSFSVVLSLYKDALFCTQPVADLGGGPGDPGPPFGGMFAKDL